MLYTTWIRRILLSTSPWWSILPISAKAPVFKGILQLLFGALMFCSLMYSQVPRISYLGRKTANKKWTCQHTIDDIIRVGGLALRSSRFYPMATFLSLRKHWPACAHCVSTRADFVPVWFSHFSVHLGWVVINVLYGTVDIFFEKVDHFNWLNK